MAKNNILLIDNTNTYISKFQELRISNKDLYGSIQSVNSTEEAEEKLNCYDYDLIFVNIADSAFDESGIFRELTKFFETLPVIVLCKTNEECYAKILVDSGADDYIFEEQFDKHIVAKSIKFAIEKKELKIKIDDNEVLFQTLFQNSEQAIYILYEGKFIKANKKFEEIFGYTFEELNVPGFNIDKIIPIKTMKQKHSPRFQGNPIYEFTAVTKSGEEIDCDICITYQNYKNSVAVQGIIHDIRSRKATEQALIESEEKFRRFFENIPIGIYRSTPDGKIVFANNSLCNMLGYTSDELLDLNILNAYYNQENRKNFKQIIETTGVVYSYEDIWKRKNGTKLYILESSRVVKGLNGEIKYYEGSVQDISDKKRNEHQLNLQNAALRTAANGIVITDKKGKVIWINPAFTKLTGYNEADVFGQNLNILKSGKQDDNYYKCMWKTISAGNVLRGEIVNKRKNGTEYVEEQTITPVLNEDDEITHYIAIKQDITERKQTENALIESEERFRSIYENAVLGIFRTSKDGKFQLANPAFIKMLGYDSYRDMVISEDLNPEIEKYNTTKIISLVDGKDEVNGVETTLKRKDGDKFFVTVNLRVVKDENNNTKFFEGTAEDITKRKVIEKKLIEAKETAEKSDKLKSEFLAQMSHEIRTPVNTILNFISLIKSELNGNGNNEIQMCFDVIGSAGNRLIRTIDLIINMSELQAGNYDYSPTKIDIYKQIKKQIMDNFNAEAQNKNIDINVINETENTDVIVDEYSISQIFSNILDNAVKYTPDGEILARFYRDAEFKLNLEIADTGIGISDEYLPYIFEPFTQEEQGYTRKFDGNGLGLALVKKYCEINNLKIKVDSRKGKGTRFNICFESKC